jgi:hypothetical protein
MGEDSPYKLLSLFLLKTEDRPERRHGGFLLDSTEEALLQYVDSFFYCNLIKQK